MYPYKNRLGKTFAHVKMMFSGTLANKDEKITQLVEKLDGVVRKLDNTVNLLVIGKKADPKIVKKEKVEPSSYFG